MQTDRGLELYTVWQHTLRLLFKKKETLAVFVLGLLFFFALLFFLEEAKEEKSVVFIGVADEDQTALSKELAKRIQDCEVFGVTQAPQRELLSLLSEGKLAAVFVIREGYEAAVHKGETNRLLTMYEADGNGLPLLADITAGEMMYDICTSKGFLTYEKVMQQAGRGQEVLSREEYAAYVMNCLSKETFDFSFQMEYIDSEGTGTDTLERTVIYVQIIFAVLTVLLGLLAVYAVIPYAALCHGRVAQRMRLLPLAKVSIWFGSGFASIAVVLLFGAAAVTMVSVKNGLSFRCVFQMFLCTAAYSSGIVIIAMLSAKAFRNTAGYQLFMLITVVAFGAAACLSIADGLLPQADWLDFVPGSAYVKAMIRFYIYGG